MKRRSAALAERVVGAFAGALLCLVATVPARADPVATWNEAVGQIVEAEHGAALPRSPHSAAPMFRSPNTARAQVALAVFEAANAVDRRYRSYFDTPAAGGPASQEAAVATAAHDVLVALFPGRAKALDQALAFDLVVLPDGPTKAAGIAVGKAAAARVLARALQPADAVVPSYRPRTSPGVYVPTDLPVLPMGAYVTTPWLLTHPGEFNPPPPPALTSERYRRDLDEVRRLGSRTSTERTPAQTAAAEFWNTHDFALMLRLLMDREQRSLVRNARIYALLAMAIDDAGTAVTVAKYDHGFWRPITAIRNAGDDGAPATSPEASWEPLLRTPLHPEYPCGHCIFAAVTAGIVAAEFGRAPPGGLTFRNPAIPGAMRTVATTDEYAREVANSRIFAGVHYRFSNEVALEMGRRAATAAVTRALQPLGGTDR